MAAYRTAVPPSPTPSQRSAARLQADAQYGRPVGYGRGDDVRQGSPQPQDMGPPGSRSGSYRVHDQSRQPAPMTQDYPGQERTGSYRQSDPRVQDYPGPERSGKYRMQDQGRQPAPMVQDYTGQERTGSYRQADTRMQEYTGQERSGSYRLQGQVRQSDPRAQGYPPPQDMGQPGSRSGSYRVQDQGRQAVPMVQDYPGQERSGSYHVQNTVQERSGSYRRQDHSRQGSMRLQETGQPGGMVPPDTRHKPPSLRLSTAERPGSARPAKGGGQRNSTGSSIYGYLVGGEFPLAVCTAVLVCPSV